MCSSTVESEARARDLRRSVQAPPGDRGDDRGQRHRQRRRPQHDRAGCGDHPGRPGLLSPRRDHRAAHRSRPARRGAPAPLDFGRLGVRRVGGRDHGLAPRARGGPPGGGAGALEHRLPLGGGVRLGVVRGGGPYRGGQGPGDHPRRGDVASSRSPRSATPGDGATRGQLGGDGSPPDGARPFRTSRGGSRGAAVRDRRGPHVVAQPRPCDSASRPTAGSRRSSRCEPAVSRSG